MLECHFEEAQAFSLCKLSSWVDVQACLILVEKRETRYRVQWYYQLFAETSRGLRAGKSVEEAHGSLLALGELLCHTGEASSKQMPFHKARSNRSMFSCRRGACAWRSSDRLLHLVSCSLQQVACRLLEAQQGGECRHHKCRPSAGKLMLVCYKEAAEAVLRFRNAHGDSKDHALRAASVGLVPCVTLDMQLADSQDACRRVHAGAQQGGSRGSFCASGTTVETPRTTLCALLLSG